ncbi:MAG: hypothetical protein ACPL3B_05875 [Fervidobacterium sp.]
MKSSVSVRHHIVKIKLSDDIQDKRKRMWTPFYQSSNNDIPNPMR